MSTTGGLGSARAEVVRLPGGDGLWVVRAEGGMTDADHAALRTAAQPAPGCTAVVVDLALVPHVSAAAVRALVATARALQEDGTTLLPATTDPRLADVLAADGALTVVGSVAEATTLCSAPEPEPGLGVAVPSPRRPEQTGGTQTGGTQTGGTQTGGTQTGGTGSAQLAVTTAPRPQAPALSPAAPASAASSAASAASASSASSASSAPPAEVVRLREEVRNLRAKVRTHPLISRAQGILEERYRLPDDRAAFALLEASSQRFNVRLRTLASAVITVPPPRSYDHEWFPQRERLSAPPLAFAPQLRAATANTAEVLSAVLRHSMEVAETGMGNVQLVDPVTGDLRIEKHHGLDDDFLEFFDRVGKDGTACAQASQQVTRVTVTDVATDELFDEASRDAVLAAGSRGCHSTPLIVPSGQVEGVVSTHHERPVRALSAAQARALDEMGVQAGRWLEWYQRTVVLDALEDLHFTGSTWRHP
ncbi:ANTAR domain-containing protein [Streptomyces sp. 891-h]|uniref:ANTAR domain-containing protein n=1 Tax=Streptomyces sp. 891-h TaxID=2720714 RepID=UPI001FAB2F6B|nr:ANTAR domain-containing protein [Streptomyces sp. 891-h]UNZ17996.1 ANTAR domain-containing protein [Streptomyces sp. 891-h]